MIIFGVFYGEILGKWLSTKDRIGTSLKIMTDVAKTALLFFLTPEEMTITDTLKADVLFAKYRIPLSRFIVNRVILTELLRDNIPEYLGNRIEMQRGCLDKIYKQSGRRVLFPVTEFDGGIRGMEMIKLMAESMFGEILEWILALSYFSPIRREAFSRNNNTIAMIMVPVKQSHTL